MKVPLICADGSFDETEVKEGYEQCTHIQYEDRIFKRRIFIARGFADQKAVLHVFVEGELDIKTFLRPQDYSWLFSYSKRQIIE